MNKKKLSLIFFSAFLLTHLAFHACVYDGRDFENLELKQAVIDGNLEKVKLLEQQGANLYQENGNQHTLLHLAAQENHPHLVGYFLSKGISANSPTQFSLYPIMLTSNLDVVKILVDAGSSSYAMQEYAVRGAPWECFEFLLTKGLIDIDGICEYGFTRLQVAAASGDIELVKKLLNRGARDYGRWHQDWGKPSEVAAKNGHHEIVQLIQESEAKHESLGEILRKRIEIKGSANSSCACFTYTIKEVECFCQDKAGNAKQTSLPNGCESYRNDDGVLACEDSK